ncbi:MAG: hypothetical protein WEB58_01460 [Planctomycetaceae bacterium]
MWNQPELPTWSALCTLLLIATGCGGVDEDRSINHSTTGERVAFQHAPLVADG